MDYEKIGEFIAQKRKEKNLTQKDLAEKIGVTDKAVSRWETGLGCPDISILEILSKELDVSVLELLKGKKIENEVIKMTEADDYIKDTFKVSKKITNDGIKKKVNIAILSTSIIIFLIVVLFNIKNYIIMHKPINAKLYNISDTYKEEYKENLSILNENIEILKNNRGKLTEEEQNKLLDFLKTKHNYYKNYKLLADTNKDNYPSLIEIYKREFAKDKYKGFDLFEQLIEKYATSEDYKRYLNVENDYTAVSYAFIEYYDTRASVILSYPTDVFSLSSEESGLYIYTFETRELQMLKEINNSTKAIMKGASINE